MNNPEFYIDHETRIRVLEEVAKDIKETMHHMDNKLDSQFKWVIGTIITMWGTLIALFGAVILHGIKLI